VVPPERVDGPRRGQLCLLRVRKNGEHPYLKRFLRHRRALQTFSGQRVPPLPQVCRARLEGTGESIPKRLRRALHVLGARSGGLEAERRRRESGECHLNDIMAPVGSTKWHRADRKHSLWDRSGIRLRSIFVAVSAERAIMRHRALTRRTVRQ
jgi:hypothetical protein